jgi:hypothetical protein
MLHETAQGALPNDALRGVTDQIAGCAMARALVPVVSRRVTPPALHL